MNELYFVSFKDYLKQNPNLINIDRELQDIRYQHAESKRLDKIKLVKEERNRLLENPNLSLESKIHSSFIKNGGNSSIHNESQYSTRQKEDKSTSLKLEQQKLEKLKQKQVGKCQ